VGDVVKNLKLNSSYNVTHVANLVTLNQIYVDLEYTPLNKVRTVQNTEWVSGECKIISRLNYTAVIHEVE